MKHRPHRTYNAEPIWLARRRRKLTIPELADLAGVSRRTILRAEQGDAAVTRAKLELLACSLCIPFESLEFREEEIKNNA
jgi:transcriptional regulator with XRE-family HTH domain